LSRINERRKLAQAEPSVEYAQKRAALLEAAARVFQAKGFDGASINDVAAESGTDRATAYYYFAGKRELFHAVIADAVESNVAAAEQIAAGEGGAADKVRELVTALLRSYEEHYPYLFVYIQEDMAKLGRDGTESTRRLRDLGRRYNSAVEAIIKSGVQSGECAPATHEGSGSADFAIRGSAVGAGLNLALAADARIVARDARMLSGFLRIGLHSGSGHFSLCSTASPARRQLWR
jgi:TetR/AcrR family transcriptional regulator, cholesterol catabolism regulator